MPPDASEDPKLKRAVPPDAAPDTTPRKMVINEKAVLIVATALAKAHHGDHVDDAGGYLEQARSFIVAAVAMHDLTEPPLVEVADPNAEGSPLVGSMAEPEDPAPPQVYAPGQEVPPPVPVTPPAPAQPAPANA